MKMNAYVTHNSLVTLGWYGFNDIKAGMVSMTLLGYKWQHCTPH